MITQRFGFTKDFAKKWNNSVYSRLSKILCGFKDQVRARPTGEKCRLAYALSQKRREHSGDRCFLLHETMSLHPSPLKGLAAFKVNICNRRLETGRNR
jgi:hypothetical protein